MWSLIFLFLPGIGFGLGLLAVSGRPEFHWLRNPSDYPLELWVIASAGSIATLGGILDWRLHRREGTVIGLKERLYEKVALGAGGAPLFALMAAASLSASPNRFLLPVLAVLLFTVVMICYDEFVFHRKRCGPFETRLHRLLVFGNGTAWLAWAHWCFVKGGIHAMAF
jgi:hypothetical protein